jgi:hypothetical protein
VGRDDVNSGRSTYLSHIQRSNSKQERNSGWQTERATGYFLVLLFETGDGGSTIFRNVSEPPPVYRTSHPARERCENPVSSMGYIASIFFMTHATTAYSKQIYALVNPMPPFSCLFLQMDPICGRAFTFVCVKMPFPSETDCVHVKPSY